VRISEESKEKDSLGIQDSEEEMKRSDKTSIEELSSSHCLLRQ
jgi:hypothetical protein